ncbi:MAG: peptidoglycan-associated lipoprotein Pal [Candidatus Schekmanbacteria bacterium]|nr:peptidoglycan-associated lipoprotein Pal [Candidatus Schekmanbacteria bacterium]
MKRSFLLLVLIVFLILGLGTGCKKKGADKSPTDRGVPATGENVGETVKRPAQSEDEGYLNRGDMASANIDKLERVHFDYDSAELTAESRGILDRNAQWMKANGGVKIIIEGHCDERGTTEYNQALGQRRARSARDYIVALGVTQDRISTISYGEERPVSEGHAESAWSLNRRAEFKALGS